MKKFLNSIMNKNPQIKIINNFIWDEQLLNMQRKYEYLSVVLLAYISFAMIFCTINSLYIWHLYSIATLLLYSTIQFIYMHTYYSNSNSVCRSKSRQLCYAIIMQMIVTPFACRDFPDFVCYLRSGSSRIMFDMAIFHTEFYCQPVESAHFTFAKAPSHSFNISNPCYIIFYAHRR